MRPKWIVLCLTLAMLVGCETLKLETSDNTESASNQINEQLDETQGIAANVLLQNVQQQQQALLDAIQKKVAKKETSTVKRKAIVVGLTKVNPKYYGGWDGDCPGCDVDAIVFANLCAESGVKTKLFLNASATYNNLIKSAKDMCKDLGSNDLLVLYISGHGGQVEDQNGDEEDYQDETLCLWDGQLVDDKINELLRMLPEGIRVFFVTDTCNSQTNYKAMKAVHAIPNKFRGMLIHYGGCADGKYSFGGPQGGLFTTALVDTFSSDNTYRSWFLDAQKLMERRAKQGSRNQIPQYEEYGNVPHEFRNTRVFH